MSQSVPALAPTLAVVDGIPTTPVSAPLLSIDDLLECGRRASELYVLLGCIASMAPADNQALTEALTLARQIGGELSNDLEVAVERMTA